VRWRINGCSLPAHLPHIDVVTGWSKRRFNPALRMVIEEAPLGLISNEIQPDYVTAYVILRAEDKVSLKRFIRERLQASP